MERSKEIFERASKVTPGGVHSGGRGLPTWAPCPPFITKGKGSKIYDVDGNEYIDYLLAYGPLILGHAHPRIMEAVRTQLENGSLFGMSHELEVEVAEIIVKNVPSAEMVKFANSGTEAVLQAVRLARASTGKSKIVKFEGHYHGWSDQVLVSYHPPLGAAGLETSPLKVPGSPGIPESYLSEVIVLPWNNTEILEKTLRERRDIAAVITEPYLISSGCIPPEEGYLQSMRELTEKYGVVLIFDEVITGFRLSIGGAQKYFGVTPDLTTFAKALGGGFPISALAGKSEFMNLAVPGKVMFAGTYNSNPIVMAAALATLKELQSGKGKVYSHLFRLGEKIIEGLRDITARLNIKAVVQGPGPVWQIFFTELNKISNYREACRSDSVMFYRFWKEAMERGILFHPHYLEHWFVSAAHTDDDIEHSLSLLEDALKAAKRAQ